MWSVVVVEGRQRRGHVPWGDTALSHVRRNLRQACLPDRAIEGGSSRASRPATALFHCGGGQPQLLAYARICKKKRIV